MSANKSFIAACASGKFDEAKKIYDLGGINIYAVIQDDFGTLCAFEESCLNNHLEIAKWLYDLDSSKISEYVWHQCCYRGYLELAKWLYTLEKERPFTYYEPLEMACQNGHLETAKWVHSIAPDILISKWMFQGACMNGRLEIIKWLYESFPYVKEFNDLALNESCYYFHVDVLLWLIKNQIYTNETINDTIDRHIFTNFFRSNVDFILKPIFEKYAPTNKRMTFKYRKYSERKHEIKTQSHLFLIPDLANLVYLYE
jgi:hypothetical protein